jgi:hypothetical protein
MRARTSVAIGTTALLALACGRPDDTVAVLATFDRFQDALFAADTVALRRLVTEESTPALEGLPFAALQTSQRLVAIDASGRYGSWQVRVRDPNHGDAEGCYVVARERGKLVVDLIATAQLHATTTTTTTPQQFVQRELSPSDRDEIRRRELATPPGEPVR